MVGNDHPFATAYPDSPAATAVPQRERDIAKAKRLLSDAGHSGGIEVELTMERFLEIPQYAVTLKELATKAAKLQQEETPGIIAYWTEELRVLKNNVAGLAKGPNIVLDMSPVWTSG